MKKLFLSVILTVLCSIFAENTQAQAFQKGTKNLSVGLTTGYGLGLNAGVDVGVTDLISVGAIGAFSSRNYGYGLGDYRVTYIGIGGRAGFHFGKYLKDAGMNDSKFDPYAGLVVGFNSVKYGGEYASFYSGSGSGLLFGGYGGIRYYFKEKLGVYLEGGFPYSSLGVTIKF